MHALKGREVSSDMDIIIDIHNRIYKTTWNVIVRHIDWQINEQEVKLTYKYKQTDKRALGRELYL